MKKSVIVLAGILSLGLNVAFAKDVECPDLVTLREDGSKFTTAFFDSNVSWQLASAPFYANEQTWQTIFSVILPAKITTTSEAVLAGQNYFDHASLNTKPDQASMGTEVICNYSPTGADYSVIAINSVQYGLRHLKA